MWLPVVLWHFGWHRCTFQTALPKKENLALNYLELGAHFCAALKELGHNNRARAILAAREKGGKWKKSLRNSNFQNQNVEFQIMSDVFAQVGFTGYRL